MKQVENPKFLVNNLPVDQYFTRETSKMIVNQPLELTNLTGQFEIQSTVTGGGPTGQAGALRLGIWLHTLAVAARAGDAEGRKKAFTDLDAEIGAFKKSLNAGE